MVSSSSAQVSILTANGDNNRTSANLFERQLTPRNVLPGQFGKIGFFPTDGQVYAQPLYVSKLPFPDGTVHDVLYIATMHNSVFAYDADRLSDAGLLWQVNLGPSFAPSLWNDTYTDISPEAGILSTGAIDLNAGVLYVVAQTLQDGAAVFSLHALDLRTGAERMNGPAVIAASASGPAGQVVFDPNEHIQRPGLLLANNSVYIGFGSHMDQAPWHGWVMSYSASDLLQQQGVFITTASGQGGAIWHSGRGLAADDAGNIYAMAGNGDFDGTGNFGESFLKLSGPTAVLADWFTPPNAQEFSDVDGDLSTGVIIIPGTHIIVGGDKNGQLYLLNGDAMGHVGTTDPSGGQVYPGMVVGGMYNCALWGQPDAAYVYVQGEGDVVRSYAIRNGQIDTAPASVGTSVAYTPRVGLSISANGAQNGILWETTGDSEFGTLHAFDASNLAYELWNSDMSPEDNLTGFTKFVNPTVANGRVYMASIAGVTVYGLLCGSESSGCAGMPCYGRPGTSTWVNPCATAPGRAAIITPDGLWRLAAAFGETAPAGAAGEPLFIAASPRPSASPVSLAQAR